MCILYILLAHYRINKCTQKYVISMHFSGDIQVHPSLEKKCVLLISRKSVYVNNTEVTFHLDLLGVLNMAIVWSRFGFSRKPMQ